LHDQIKAAAEAYLQLGLIQMGQAEQMLNTATSFNNPFLIVFSSLFMGLLCGCVLGLVISIFVQRKGNPFNQPTT
jgi:NhaP-type Na+/H+ or K+/H+ antiporter